MSKIDKIFKEGLDQKGLAYSDAHWAGMEALLDKKKKGILTRFKWYFLSLLLLIGITTYLSWRTYHQNNSKSEFALTGTKNNKTTINNTPIVSKIATNLSIENTTKEITPNITINQNPISDKIGTSSGKNSNNSFFNIGPSNIPKNTSGPASSSTPESNDLATTPSLRAELLYLKIRDFYLFPSYLTSPSFKKQFLAFVPPVYKWHFYAAPFVQLNSHKRMLQLGTESELKQQEKPLPELGLGINILAKKGHWVVKSGIHFNQLKERTNYESTYNTTTYDTSFRMVIKYYTQTPRGSNVALLETKIDTTTGPTETRINNPNSIAQFNYISIPLAVQYEWHQKRILYFVEAGANLSILTNAKGVYALHDASTNTLTSRELSNNLDALNKTILNVSGAVGVKYAFTHNFNLWSSYSQNFGMNSMISDYAQKVNTSGINLGLEYKLY